MQLGSYVKKMLIFGSIFTFALMVVFSFFPKSPTPPSFSTWKEKQIPGELTLLDRNDKIIYEERRGHQTRRHQWLNIENLPENLINELITIEDKRFYQHQGIDFLASLASLKTGVLHHYFRGGSTLTMQVVNLLYPQLKKEKKWIYKWQQAWMATKLEQTWQKKNILEAYLNLVSFKGELQGIVAATLALYQKLPQQLSFPERMWLLAMIPSPNQATEKLQPRACRYGKKIDPNFKCDQLMSFAPVYKSIVPVKLTPHFARQFKKAGIYKTTLDKSIQESVMGYLANHLQHLEQQNVRDGAVLVIERKSGNVLAYVGSSGEKSLAPAVDHVKSRRQAGSTLKPLLYAQAIELKLLTMSSPLKDEPFAISIDGLTYQPENYNRSFLNKAVPLKEALGSSLNIPAVKTIDLIHPGKFYFWLKRFGINLVEDEHFYGHSLALGAADISLWDLVHAYQQLASGNKVLSKEVSFIISSILSEKENRIYSFGLDSILNTNSWSAVKTGTSKDMRDNWCVGFTDRYVIGVWVGNSSGSPMWNVTGISGAAPIFAEVVQLLHHDSPSLAPTVPTTLVTKNQNYYLKGTEPRENEFHLKTTHGLAKIISPTNKGEYAYDPDIPAKSQRLPLKSTGVSNPHWVINGKNISDSTLSLEKRGRYILELWDEKEKRDEVVFLIKAGKTLPSFK